MKIIISLLAMSMALAVAMEPGFDPKDIVRQLREARGGNEPACHSERRRSSPAPSVDDGEFLIDTSVTYIPVPGNQEVPAVAFDGTNFLLVWDDHRSSDCDIFAARVTPAGRVLDSMGIPVSFAEKDQSGADVAFDGTNFLVVWSDGRSGSWLSVYGARVTPAGAVLDPAGIVISSIPNGQGLPAVAFDGANCLVVWADCRSGGDPDIYGARVAPSGTVLDPTGIPICTAADAQRYPALAFDGADFLVVWDDYRSGDGHDIYGARVTTAGAVLDPTGIVVSTAANDQESPAVASDGASFLVVWHGGGIYGARVTSQGTVLDTSGIPICLAEGYQWQSAVAFDGANFLVVWTDERNGPGYDIYGARVTPGGIVLDTAGIGVSVAGATRMVPAITFDGANFLVVWEDWRIPHCPNIYAARVAPSGTVLDPAGIAVSGVASGGEQPAVAFDGANYLVVWTDARSEALGIYGARVTPSGTVLDPRGFPVSTGASGRECPSVAYGGANYLVTWEDWRDGQNAIYAARVTPQGAVLDPSGIPVSTGYYLQESPAVAFDGANFLVVWGDDFRSGDAGIYGARVTPTGVVLDTGIAISIPSGYQGASALGFDGANSLVVWEDFYGAYDVYGARVTPGGVVLDTTKIAVANGAHGQRLPALAFDGESFLVVWEDYRSGDHTDIYGARVTPAGAVLDTTSIAVSTVADGQTTPAVAFDGANFLVVWEDYRNGDRTDIYGARVSQAGVVFDSGPVVRQEGAQVSPALARGAGSQMFLVYRGWAGTVGGRIYNTQRIWGKMNPSTGIEESPKPQASDHNLQATVLRRLPAGSVAFDAMGRRAVNPKSGVYFVRDEGRGAKDVGRTRKVVIQR